MCIYVQCFAEAKDDVPQRVCHDDNPEANFGFSP